MPDPTTTLADIEAATKAYAQRRELLAEQVQALNDAIAALKKDRLPAVRRALQRAAEKQAELQALIESAPHLFVKPRTLILHGVRIGFVKGRGTIEIEDKTRTVALIRRYLPDQAETLIRTTELPHKPALSQLTVADLKRIGCSVSETGDQVVIAAVDSEVDKMVDALLADAVETEASEVAA